MPPPGHEPFIRAICADPEDDAVRLVYADWLDENGDPDRAEFIRLQIFRAANPARLDPRDARIEELREANFLKWCKDEPRLSGIFWPVVFARGFRPWADASATCPLADHLPIMCRATPLQHLVLSDFEPAGVDAVLGLSEMEQMTVLDLRRCKFRPGDWGGLIRAPKLRRLTHLGLCPVPGPDPVLSDEDARAFADGPFLPALETVSLGGWISDEAHRTLLTRFKSVPFQKWRRPGEPQDEGAGDEEGS